MEIFAQKLSLIRWLTDLNDISIIKKIEEIRKNYFFEHGLSRLSIEEIIERNELSENDIKNNRLIEQDSLSAYFERK